MAVAVYAGSFDPVTLGHIAIIRDSSKLFDRVIVLIADNPDKRTLFSMDERMEMLKAVTADMKKVVCDVTDGIVVEYARDNGACFLVRGIRDTTDAECEMKLTEVNRMIAPEIQTLFIPSERKLSKVSSSNVKAIARQGEDISDYCPQFVQEMLLKKIESQK